MKMTYKSLITYSFFWFLFLAQCVTIFYCMINSSGQMSTLAEYGIGIWLLGFAAGALILFIRSLPIDRYSVQLTVDKNLSNDDLVTALSRSQTQPLFATILYFILWNVVHLATYACFKMTHIGNLAALSLLGGWIGGMLTCPLMVFGVLNLLHIPVNTLFYDEIHKRGIPFKGIQMTIKLKLMTGFVLFGLGVVIWLGSAAFYTGVIQMVEEIKSSNLKFLRLVSVTIPIKGDERLPVKELAQLVADRAHGEDLFFWADVEGNIVWSQDQASIYVDKWTDINDEIGHALKRGEAKSIYENVTEQVISLCPVGTFYRLGLISRVTERMDRFAAFKYWFVFFVAVGLFVGYVIGYTFISEASKSIVTAASKLKQLAADEGDLTKRLSMSGEDEVGHLILAFNAFMEKLRRMISAISQNSISLNDSSAALSKISQKMSEEAVQMTKQAGSVASAAEEVSVNMTSITSAMEQTSVNTGVIAASVEEMTSTIHTIAGSSGRALEITTKAVNQSNTASEKVDQMGIAAQKIGKVTEVITEISEQTNLLALNATIEAARAGEAGKGFTVVANEIKELSKQTAEATQQIKKQISEMQESTLLSIQEIKRVANVIAEVSDIVTGIASAVEEQSATTSEIAGNIVQASQGIDEVKNNIVQVSSATQLISQDISGVDHGTREIKESSSQVSSNAHKLTDLAGRLKEMVGKFKY